VEREKCTRWIKMMRDVHCLHDCDNSTCGLLNFVLQSFCFGDLALGQVKLIANVVWKTTLNSACQILQTNAVIAIYASLFFSAASLRNSRMTSCTIDVSLACLIYYRQRLGIHSILTE